MTLQRILLNLNAELETASDQAAQANQAFRDAKNRLQDLKRFQEETFAHEGDISVVNLLDAHENHLSILTRYYRLEGKTVLFTITPVVGQDDDIFYVGQIIDYKEKTVSYACQFYYRRFDKKEDLFDRLLANYAEWRFGL